MITLPRMTKTERRATIAVLAASLAIGITGPTIGWNVICMILLAVAVVAAIKAYHEVDSRSQQGPEEGDAIES